MLFLRTEAGLAHAHFSNFFLDTQLSKTSSVPLNVAMNKCTKLQRPKGCREGSQGEVGGWIGWLQLNRRALFISRAVWCWVTVFGRCQVAERSIQNCLIIMKPDDVIMVWLHKVTLFNSLIFWFLLSVGAYKHMGAISPCVYSIVSASNIKLWQDGSTQCGLWNVWWLLKFAEMWQCLYKIARLSQCKQWIFLNQ